MVTSKVFMGDSDKVEGSEQMVKLAIQQFGFRLVLGLLERLLQIRR